MILLLLLFVLRMGDNMKTQLVSAIHLQEVELQEKATERKSRWFRPPAAEEDQLRPGFLQR